MKIMEKKIKIDKHWCIHQTAGAVEIVLWGVVGRDPAREWVVEAFSDCIVPICKILEIDSMSASKYNSVTKNPTMNTKERLRWLISNYVHNTYHICVEQIDLVSILFSICCSWYFFIWSGNWNIVHFG